MSLEVETGEGGKEVTIVPIIRDYTEKILGNDPVRVTVGDVRGKTELH